MRPEIRRLGKERFVCLLALFAFAPALHLYLTSAPRPLEAASPRGSSDLPAPVLLANPAPLPLHDSVLSGGRPFTIAKPPTQPRGLDEGAGTRNAGGPTGAPVVKPVKITQPAKDYPPVDPKLPLQFVGVVFVGGSAHGLLRPQDGSALFHVRAGDSIPAYGCTVTGIEKQAIKVAGPTQAPFVFGDGRFRQRAAPR
ncbi:MAG: hypothetical protein NTW87_35580 [Planctomycetota bacterium]|nr:hypothetical protein [Planctomycetota bacterium]